MIILKSLIDYGYGEMSRGGYRPGSGRKSGFISEKKGKTFEEIYGSERAAKIKEKSSISIRKHYETHDAWNKGKPLQERHPFREYSFKKGHTPWNKGLKGWNNGHPVSKETRKKIGEARMHRVFPKKDSSIEVAVQNILSKNRVVFETHYPIIGQPDIAFSEKKIAVFCDGEYWHNLPKQIKRDKEVNEALSEMGWTVLRFNGQIIKENIEGVYKMIRRVL